MRKAPGARGRWKTLSAGRRADHSQLPSVVVSVLLLCKKHCVRVAQTPQLLGTSYSFGSVGQSSSCSRFPPFTFALPCVPNTRS